MTRHAARRTATLAAATAILCILVGLLLLAPTAAAAPPELVVLAPEPGSAVKSGVVEVRIQVTDPDGPPEDGVLPPERFEVYITASQSFSVYTGEEDQALVQDGVINYTIGGIFTLAKGTHVLGVRYVDAGGEAATASWNVTVDPTLRVEQETGELPIGLIVVSVGGVLVVAVGGATGLYVWARKRHRFTIRKHLARNPHQRALLALYVPTGIGVVATLVGLWWAQGWDEVFAMEIVLLGGVVLSLAPYTWTVLRARKRRHLAERAYAQFLFETADAVRGGIDPIKAVKELAATETGILRRPLLVAADHLRLGQPFDEVMQDMARDLGSPLIERYATLVAEAARAGGDISMVIHQGAKDMDALVAISEERLAQMRGPATTMYIAYGVLFMLVATLVDFAPSLGSIDLSALGIGGPRMVPPMSFETMTRRFFHLLLVASIGTGLLVGSFTEGKLRYGLLHMSVMTGISVVAYPLFVA